MIEVLGDITQGAELGKNDFPGISEYRFLYNQMLVCQSNGCLDCVKRQMKFIFGREKPTPLVGINGKVTHLATIGPKEGFEHPEYKLLVEAGKLRRHEINP